MTLVGSYPKRYKIAVKPFAGEPGATNFSNPISSKPTILGTPKVMLKYFFIWRYTRFLGTPRSLLEKIK